MIGCCSAYSNILASMIPCVVGFDLSIATCVLGSTLAPWPCGLAFAPDRVAGQRCNVNTSRSCYMDLSFTVSHDNIGITTEAARPLHGSKPGPLHGKGTGVMRWSLAGSWLVGRQVGRT